MQDVACSFCVPQRVYGLLLGRSSHTTCYWHFAQEDLSVEALKRLDLQKLRNRVAAPSAACGKYFGHFCALLHLEYFVEAVFRATKRGRHGLGVLGTRSGGDSPGGRSTSAHLQAFR